MATRLQKSVGLLWASWLLVGAAEIPQLPELPKEQVERAIAASRAEALAKVKNLYVVPQWIEGTDTFWYKKEIEGGVNYVLVDAASGQKRPLFDHQALAAATASISGKPVAEIELPLTGVEMKGSVPIALTSIDGKTFRCTIDQAPVCTPDSQPAPDPSVSLSPDKKRALYVKDHNLWLRDVASGREQALTTDGIAYNSYGNHTDGDGFRRIIDKRAGRKSPPLAFWAPNSRFVVSAQYDDRQVEPYPFIENSPVDGSFRPKVHLIRSPLMGERPGKVRWVVIDTVSGTVRPIDYPKNSDAQDDVFSVVQTKWDDDSRFIFTFVQTRDNSRKYLFRTDATTGAARTIVEDASLNKRIFGFGSVAAPFRIVKGGRQLIWPTARDGFIHVELRDAITGQRKNGITGGRWTFRNILRVDEATNSLIFTASGREPGNPYDRYIYKIGLDGKGLRLLSPEQGDKMVSDPVNTSGELDGTIPHESLSPSGKYVVYGVSTPTKPARFLIRRTSDGSQVSEFERTDASALFATGYKLPEEFVATSADGKHKLYGLVYRPTGYDPSRKYPVMDAQYTSPLVAVTPRTFSASVGSFTHFASYQANAELGFVVVVVDARGTPARSLDFASPEPHYLRKMGLDDHVAFIRQLAAKDPGVDLDRVGISGASFGGWGTLRGLLEYPDFFKLGIAITAPGAFQNMWDAPGLTNSHAMPRYEGGGSFRPQPSDVPGNFQDINGPAQVERLKGKLLMIIGEQDENVYPGSSMQFFDAAQKADKDVTLIQIPNATHGVIGSHYAVRKAWEFALENMLGMRLSAGTVVPTPMGSSTPAARQK